MNLETLKIMPTTVGSSGVEWYEIHASHLNALIAVAEAAEPVSFEYELGGMHDGEPTHPNLWEAIEALCELLEEEQ